VSVESVPLPDSLSASAQCPLPTAVECGPPLSAHFLTLCHHALPCPAAVQLCSCAVLPCCGLSFLRATRACLSLPDFPPSSTLLLPPYPYLADPTYLPTPSAYLPLRALDCSSRQPQPAMACPPPPSERPSRGKHHCQPARHARAACGCACAYPEKKATP
jgi:hypothetical protein